MEIIMNNQKIDLSKDFITFPEEWTKRYSEEEIHKMMSSHNSDVPIEKVVFKDYPRAKAAQ